VVPAILGGLANAVEALVVAAVMLRLRVARFRTPLDVVGFAIAVVLGGAVGALLGAAVMAGTAGASFADTAQSWFAADVTGMVFIVPLLVTVSWRRLDLLSRRALLGYLGLLAIAVVLSTLIVVVPAAVGAFGTFLAWYVLLLVVLLVGIQHGIAAMGLVQVPVAVAAFASVAGSAADEWLMRQGIATVIAVSLLLSVVAVRGEVGRRIRSEALARDLFRRSPVATARVRVASGPATGEGRVEVLEANPAWHDLLGSDPGDDLLRSVDLQDVPALRAALDDGERGGGVEVRCLSGADGRDRLVRFDALSARTPLRTAGAELVVVAQDVTDQREIERALERQARMDGLTGLLNRTAFEGDLAERLARRNQRPSALVFVDLDGFKAINDTLGHAAGDAVLREVAARLAASVRPRDLVGRFGGDEFVLHVDLEGPEDLAGLVDRIGRVVSAAMDISGTEVVAGASIGTAMVGPEDSAEALIDRADEEMYRRKRRGSAVQTRSMAEE
jgi:diguanylate cyclase (GGDEF)-like protein